MIGLPFALLGKASQFGIGGQKAIDEARIIGTYRQQLERGFALESYDHGRELAFLRIALKIRLGFFEIDDFDVR